MSRMRGVAAVAACAEAASSMGKSAPSDFARWCEERVRGCERALEALLPPAQELPSKLHEAMRYAVLGGGKRVRPLIVYAAGELGACSSAALDCAACAVELIHAYSLVHDDLPCMDDDTLRRGKPTVHVAFGEATAMLAGDALQALAFQAVALAADRGASPAATVQMLSQLALAAGSLGMAGGQAIDLESVGFALDRTQLEAMHRRKTGAMLQASVMMGAACVASLTASQRSCLSQYAQAVGLAFQVIDDVLDVEADSATLGKTAGKDAAHHKPTYVSVLGLAEARKFAMELSDTALAALEPLGPAAQRLADLAHLIVRRPS